MITLFENYSKDYQEIDLSDLSDGPLTYSVFNKNGDKEHKWNFQFQQNMKNAILNKIITYKHEGKERTELVTNISFIGGDSPMIIFRLASQKSISIFRADKVRIWNEDSEIAQEIRMKQDAKKYNL